MTVCPLSQFPVLAVFSLFALFIELPIFQPRESRERALLGGSRASADNRFRLPNHPSRLSAARYADPS